MDKYCTIKLDNSKALYVFADKTSIVSHPLGRSKRLTQQVFRQKIEYLQLLLENPSGLTANEVSDFYFDDAEPSTTRKALTRLYRNGDATRQKEGRQHRYWISDKGVRKLEYLLGEEE